MSPCPDPRHISNGYVIPSECYADQPYVVRTDDGAWLCVLTTSSGREGQHGQHVVTARSTDQGRTWSPLVDVEPADGPEASYAVLLKGTDGRVFCFYNHNSDDRRWVIADDPPYPGGRCERVDSQGYFVWKASHDHGRTWAASRTPIPIREFAIDRENAYGGKVQFFWNVGRAFHHEGVAYVSLHKVGGFGEGFFTRSEGVLLASDNLLTEADPARVRWETLPEGDRGLAAPVGLGPIAEEQSFSVLSDGSFFCVYRTISGYSVCCYSRDKGRSWSPPRMMRYANGRPIKHPRAANFCWACGEGRYLYWYHNHGGTWYEDRNPVWLSGGVEIDGAEEREIAWSQPEIALYDDDPYVRLSYPDLIIQDGRYDVTETQKDVARVHALDGAMLEALWGQHERRTRTDEGLLLDASEQALAGDEPVLMPELPAFTMRDGGRADYGTKELRAGFTIEMWVRFDALVPGGILLNTRADDGQGMLLEVMPEGALRFTLNDGRTENAWASDPNRLTAGQLHHVAIVVDAGPKIMLFIIDGVLCDGGEGRQFGWGRFSPHLRHANGADEACVGPFDGEVISLRIYGRALWTSEVVGNNGAGAD